MKDTAAIITVKIKGKRDVEFEDKTGDALMDLLEKNNWSVSFRMAVENEKDVISEAICRMSDEKKVNLVITSGGVGFAKRDITPEVTKEIIERECIGIQEAMRAESMRITPRGMFSRGIAGIRKRTLIINLPGHSQAACDNLNAVIEPLHHAVEMMYIED